MQLEFPLDRLDSSDALCKPIKYIALKCQKQFAVNHHETCKKDP